MEIPLFPLNIVVFPNEKLNLHIFEPRYKQLTRDCLDNQMTFGIPSYVNNKIELGTEVEIIEVTKVYPDERMDIKTKGLRILEVTKFQNPWNGKLYAGGEVFFHKNIHDADAGQLLLLKEKLTELFAWLGEPAIQIENIQSVFDIGHKIGLKPEEEYQLLVMEEESKRIEYVNQHLDTLLPALERAQNAQERIKQNGHFKYLDPLKF